MNSKKLLYALLTVFLVLLVDQWLKIYVKTSFFYNESRPVFGDWFTLNFVENPGFAYGLEIPLLSKTGAKITLSVFRIVAVGVIGVYLFQLIKKGISTALIVCISLVFAGAIGNIVDSAVYGLIFSNSKGYHQIAELVPFGEGYAGFLLGDVVDMLHFDLFTVELPIYGTFRFFAPVFNVADFAISMGVGIILVFLRKEFQEQFFTKEEEVLPASERADN